MVTDLAFFTAARWNALMAANGSPLDEDGSKFVSHWAGRRFRHETILALVARNLLRLDGAYPARRAAITDHGAACLARYRLRTWATAMEMQP